MYYRLWCILHAIGPKRLGPIAMVITSIQQACSYKKGQLQRNRFVTIYVTNFCWPHLRLMYSQNVKWAYTVINQKNSARIITLYHTLKTPVLHVIEMVYLSMLTLVTIDVYSQAIRLRPSIQTDVLCDVWNWNTMYIRCRFLLQEIGFCKLNFRQSWNLTFKSAMCDSVGFIRPCRWTGDSDMGGGLCPVTTVDLGPS